MGRAAATLLHEGAQRRRRLRGTSGQGTPTRWSIHAVNATGGTATCVERSYAVSRADAPKEPAWAKRAAARVALVAGLG
eukprot:6551220-Prymnesium_polylepis.1